MKNKEKIAAKRMAMLDNTLQTLIKDGIVKELKGEDGQDRYVLTKWGKTVMAKQNA